MSQKRFPEVFGATRSLAVGCLIPAILLAGCQSGGSSGTTSGANNSAPSATETATTTIKAGEGETLVPQSRPPVVDLPIPIDCELDAELSRSYMADESRVVDHYYRCKSALKSEVEPFYRYQMPLNDWRFRGVQELGDETKLRYQKGDQWCEIVIRPWNRTFGTGTIVHVTVQMLTPTR